MSKQAEHEHFRYTSGARTVHAVMQDGHNGSILNCAHPSCRLDRLLADLKALRLEWDTADDPRVRALLFDLDGVIARHAGDTTR